MHTDENFDVDKFRENDENPSSWKLRKKFLSAHWRKFPADRLVCLSKCFVNVEQDGCRYPELVMKQLAELKKELPDLVEEQKDVRKRKYKMNFVKASETSSSDLDNTSPLSSNTSVSHVLKEKEMSCGFVKSRTPYKSTDICSSSSSSAGKQSQNQDGKRMKFASNNFKTALKQITKNAYEEELDNRFINFAKTVKLLQNEAKNDIEIIYEAASKLHMSVQFNTEFTESGSCYECTVFIDSVEVAREKGPNKKVAKHNAFKIISKKLREKYLKVVSSKLVSSDFPFNGVLSHGETSSEQNQNQKPESNLKKPHKESLKHLNQFLVILPMDFERVSSTQILQQSTDFNKAALSYYYYPDIGGIKCCIAINDLPVIECLACTKHAAQIQASDVALELLKEQCWTVCLKKTVDTDQARLSKDDVLGDIEKESQKIPESNIGNKLLRKMGWAGGGVGKDGMGISDPVAVEQVVNRKGLGLHADSGISVDMKAKLEEVVLNYVRSDREDDLVFEPNFTKEERAILHQFSQQLGLLSRSYGKGENRYLTIRRKRSAKQLFNHIMNHGGSTSKYDLYAPGTFPSSSRLNSD